jgi:hypothetical protein
MKLVMILELELDFSTSKNLTVKSIIFPRRKIHKFTWTFPDEETHNQMEHIQVYLMSDRSGQQIVILTTVGWWQKIGRDWKSVKKQHTDFICRGSI